MANTVNFNSEMQELANIIAQYAPENWSRMSLSFEWYSVNDYGIDSFAVVDGAKIPVDMDEEDIDSTESIFSTIRKKTVEKWKTAIFEFSCDGDCEINFAY